MTPARKLVTLDEAERVAANRPSRLTFPKLMTFVEMGEVQQPERLIRRLLGTSTLAVIYGPPKCGKTFFALGAALSIASGNPFFGRKVTAGLVLYVAAEGGSNIHNRIAAYKLRNPEAEDIAFAVYPEAVDLGPESKGAETVIDLCRLCTQLWDGAPVIAVVIDTLNRCIGAGDENTSEGMGAFVQSCDKIRNETGAAVVVVHHTGKDSGKGMRGHSSLLGAVDSAIEVEKREGGNVATVRASRDGAEGTEINFTLDLIEIGTDDEGEAITSCIAVASDAATAPPAARLNPAEQRALDQLHKAIASATERPPGSNHIPTGVPAASYEVWRSYCYSADVSGADSPEAKRQAFGRAAKSLTAKGRIGKWDEWVWVVQ